MQQSNYVKINLLPPPYRTRVRDYGDLNGIFGGNHYSRTKNPIVFFSFKIASFGYPSVRCLIIFVSNITFMAFVKLLHDVHTTFTQRSYAYLRWSAERPWDEHYDSMVSMAF